MTRYKVIYDKVIYDKVIYGGAAFSSVKKSVNSGKNKILRKDDRILESNLMDIISQLEENSILFIGTFSGRNYAPNLINYIQSINRILEDYANIRGYEDIIGKINEEIKGYNAVINDDYDKGDMCTINQQCHPIIDILAKYNPRNKNIVYINIDRDLEPVPWCLLRNKYDGLVPIHINTINLESSREKINETKQDIIKYKEIIDYEMGNAEIDKNNKIQTVKFVPFELSEKIFTYYNISYAFNNNKLSDEFILELIRITTSRLIPFVINHDIGIQAISVYGTQETTLIGKHIGQNIINFLKSHIRGISVDDFEHIYRCNKELQTVSQDKGDTKQECDNFIFIRANKRTPIPNLGIRTICFDKNIYTVSTTELVAKIKSETGLERFLISFNEKNVNINEGITLGDYNIKNESILYIRIY